MYFTDEQNRLLASYETSLHSFEKKSNMMGMLFLILIFIASFLLAFYFANLIPLLLLLAISFYLLALLFLSLWIMFATKRKALQSEYQLKKEQIIFINKQKSHL
ncbi:MAG: hypothetical protein LKF69_03255 [Bacilli bacterium]|jgi:Flp pilus assembly protein TadB|nr:hypothetical protein [Bacilli bacterium]MCH4235798.1 hypothetical protein [Bacilli bacterium]